MPSGDYFVVTRYSADTTDLFWRLPVRIEDPVKVADLTAANAIDMAAEFGMPAVVGARQIIDEMLQELPRQRAGARRSASRVRQKTRDEPLPEEFTRPLSCS